MRQLMTEHKSAADSAPLSLSFRVAELEEVRGMSNTLASAQTSTVAELNTVRGLLDILLALAASTHVGAPQHVALVDNTRGCHKWIIDD